MGQPMYKRGDLLQIRDMNGNFSNEKALTYVNAYDYFRGSVASVSTSL